MDTMTTATATTTEPRRVNGLDVDALAQVIEDVGKDPAKGMVRFRVTSGW